MRLIDRMIRETKGLGNKMKLISLDGLGALINMDLGAMIQSLPIPVIQRMYIERASIIGAKKIKKLILRKSVNTSTYWPLVRNNRFYGDEFLLREYADLSKPLYAIIEHGLYFGNNTARVGLKHEWELGTILTPSKYRKNLINKVFPEFYCETIGPMIHYATPNNIFKEKLLNGLDSSGRTLLFFPVHGNEKFSPVYDTEKSINKIIEIANKWDCKNIIISVFLDDIAMFSGVAEKLGVKERIKIASSGDRYNENFLRNQRSMIESADITVSNSLGTHLGYCIYLGKPHILLPQDFSYEGDEKARVADFGSANRSENWKNDFDRETLEFQGLFDGSTETITSEQFDVCNFYWGFDQVRTMEELRKIVSEVNSYAKRYVRHHRFKG